MSAPADLAAAIQALASSAQASVVDPADALLLLESLADFSPTSPASTAPVGAAVADMADAIGDLCRRTAVIALALAAETYQPASYDDAVAVRDAVTALLDAEITVAGDQGEDASWSALRALRVAVIQDLTARGATLAPITNFTLGASLPSLVLANRLYRDASRADELVTQVDPIHPLFMPSSFQALSR